MLLKIKDELYKSFMTLRTYLQLKMKQLDKHPILQLITFSVALILILEMLNQRSVLRGWGFIISNPLMFLFNVLIVLLTFVVTMMFSRRKFLLMLISTLWLGLGLANYVLLFFRTTPLSAMEFLMLKLGMEIVHMYLNTFEIILILSSVVVVIIAMIYLCSKCPKNQAQFKMPLITIVITIVLMFLVGNVSLRVNALAPKYSNLGDAYVSYGFVYCFSNSIFDRGIEQPDEYSEENVAEVINKIKKLPAVREEENNTKLKPNVIMVQLESFFDVNHLINYRFSENPTPNFTRLKQEYSFGYVRVPSIGAGTANTEFEVLTGMNIEHFGAGEYPYKTILKETTAESIGYNLGERGYHSHAIHNHAGTFYERNTVFPKLGFDSFSSIEFMNNVEYNPVGWAKDYVLTEEVVKALKASNARDFVYTISVQPHGKYPETVIDENQRIKLVTDPNNIQPSTGNIEGNDSSQRDKKDDKVDIDEGYKNKLEYFANQLYETDEFIGQLIDELKDYNEPTVVVFFGDHLPALSIENEDLVNNDKFQMEYVLWSNFSMKKVNRDLNAYQLSSYVMERLGYENGILTKFHQKNKEESDYQEELKLLQYDMLYGNRSVYQGQNPHIEKSLQMGINEISITDVTEKGETIFVEGNNFTPWSVVYLDDKPQETLFVDENTLIVPYKKFSGENVYVAQVSSNNNIILSKSEEWKIPRAPLPR